MSAQVNGHLKEMMDGKVEGKAVKLLYRRWIDEGKRATYPSHTLEI